MSYSISGIHTGIGKTICSAVLCEALGYDYWKPVQAGDLENSDSVFIKNHVTNSACKIHDEAYRLTKAASPHWSAMEDHVEITAEKLILPATDNNIIIETAGGIMSPLSKTYLNINLIKQLDFPTILVSNNYLGSINHTLLSWQILQQSGVKIAGIIYSGEEVKSSRDFISEYTKLSTLLSIPLFKSLNKEHIKEFAASIRNQLNEKLNEFAGKG